MKILNYKLTDTEYNIINEAKTIWLNKQGMALDDAEKTSVENWVLDHLIWKITWNLVDKPPGYKIRKPK